ncbi:thioesterase II family protein [Streptomyces sp. NPDC058525]|uniref:thioesterase II family protein n=1 Tax=unclassified Streptomyces TaxID=2593676 RepID=UPI003654EFDB
MSKKSPWLVAYGPGPDAETRVVTFPHAGGSASWFRDWAQHLGPGCTLRSVQYPGRENRLAEPLVPAMKQLAQGVAEALAEEPDGARETVFFGHSMGAAVAYETLRLLEAWGSSSVTRLCVSGRELRAGPEPGAAVIRDDEALMASMTRLGGTRSAVFDDPDLREMVLDIVRNDYHLVDTYRADPGAAPVRADVLALTGDRDPQVDLGRIDAWASVTTGSYARHVFPGGHFYLADHAPRLLRLATGAPAAG